MTRDLKASLTIEAKDRAGDTLRRVSSTAQREADRVADRTRRAANEGARAQERASLRSQTAHARESRAREQLGIRSESRIRREIMQTEAAYNRLARAGRLSAAEQSRAYGQMQNRVSGLRREMTGLEQQQRRTTGSRVMQAGAFAMQAGVPVAAAVATIARPVTRTMNYESRLAMMANTAYADRDASGRISGMRDLDGAIRNAVRQGGGKRDDAAATLDNMLASGALDHASAVNLLPTLQKASVATGASGTELADVVIRAMQTFDIQENQIPQMLDMAVKAGQGGGFELKDMARWLPKMMAMARTSGMSGLEDFGTLVAAAQASLITGGSTDAGGNNLANLLAKINSRDTARQAEKLEIAPGKSIDLAGTLAQAAGQGTNSLDAFVGIVEQVVRGNKDYQALQSKLAGMDPESQRGEMAAIMQKQSDILEGSAIGQLIQDQQALLALVGYMGNRDYVREIAGTYGNGVDAVGVSHNVMAATDEFKLQQAGNEWEAAEFNAFKGFAGGIGDLAEEMTGLAAEYPKMATAVVATTEALKVLAAVAGSAYLLSALRGRAGGRVAGRAGGAAGAATGAAVGGSKALSRTLGRTGAAGPLLAAAGAYGAYQTLSDETLTPDQRADALINQGGRTAGSIAGAYFGAGLGTALIPIPGVGTMVGGVAGGIAGDYVGDYLGDYINQLRGSSDATESGARKSVVYKPGQAVQWDNEVLKMMIDAQNKPPQGVDVKVTVDVQNGNIVASVNEVNERNGRRN